MSQAENDNAVADACDVCLRPKYSGDDLKRWQDEVAEVTAMGGDAEKYNPEWARAVLDEARVQVRLQAGDDGGAAWS